MIIAVDFDGTIVEHKYPAIGKERTFAVETLKMLHKQGHQLILWTYRSGKELDEAVAFCESKGLEFYAINKNYPEEVFNGTQSRKIIADVYIDDRNVGGFLGWGEIWHLLNEDATDAEKANYRSLYNKSVNKGFCGWLIKLFCKNRE